jgi:hypothetical protein
VYHKEASSKLIVAVGHHKLIKLINGLFGHHKLTKLNGLVLHHELIKLINGFIGNSKLTKLTSLFHGCHIKLFKLSKLIVNLFLNPNYTRARAVPITSYSNSEGEWGHCAHENYSHFNKDHLRRLIVNSDSEGALFGLSKSQPTLRNEESKLIVVTDSINADTKIPFTFFDRRIIFCEGETGDDFQNLIATIALVMAKLVELTGLVSHNNLIDFSGHNSLIGFISLVDRTDLVEHNGLIGRNDLLNHIGLDYIGHNGLVGFIGHGFIGFIGLGLVSLIGLIGLSLVGLIGLIGLISLGDLDIISLNGLSALPACQLIGLVVMVSLSNHWLHDCLAAAMTVAAATISMGLTTHVAHSNGTEITNVASIYYFTTSLLHVHLLVREKMCWWLALARKKL